MSQCLGPQMYVLEFIRFVLHGVKHVLPVTEKSTTGALIASEVIGGLHAQAFHFIVVFEIIFLVPIW